MLLCGRVTMVTLKSCNLIGLPRSLSMYNFLYMKLPDPLSCGDWRVRLVAHADPVHYVVIKSIIILDWEDNKKEILHQQNQEEYH